MNRRRLIKSAAAAALLPSLAPQSFAADSVKDIAAKPPLSRVRPGHPAWPAKANWERLKGDVGGRLIDVQSPLRACRNDPAGLACDDVFAGLRNPYWVADEVGLTQTSGWLDAWTSQPSIFAVAAKTAGDVAAAVNFAREHNLRLVVKGVGHSYLGTSSAPDSLMIWTRHMDGIGLHDGFVPQGCAGVQPAQPAVTVGPGAIWMHLYNAVTTQGGRYVQGGGCLTIGVGGFVQVGGFGSFSKNYGTAAADLLEAEIVTADGAVRIANACTNADLFWALKGGGGGSFGVVTRLTLRTRELPQYFGFVFTIIRASSDAAFRRLIGQFLTFYAESLLNPQWGDIVTMRRDNALVVEMSFQAFDRQQAQAVWQPFLRMVAAAGSDLNFTIAPRIVAIPARQLWDPAYMLARNAGLVDDRPGAPKENLYWAGERSEFLYGMESLWLPRSLLRPDGRERLADALFTATRHRTVALHFQKGLAGASEEAAAAVRDTATNPAVLDAFVLAMIGGGEPPAFPGLLGHEPDLHAGRKQAAAIGAAAAELRKAASDAGAYVAQSSFFEPEWQRAYWGPNYAKLLAVKRKYDPGGPFFVHHGVGSEDWSADGFKRLAAPWGRSGVVAPTARPAIGAFIKP
jgi:FAD/FMN-containing dehydrogenase